MAAASNEFSLRPIGRIVSQRVEPIDDGWDAIASSIELDGAVVSADATRGLEDFSHIVVIYVFDQVDPQHVQTGARHPRGNISWPVVGILAQRAKNRPNRLGVCCCRLVSVEGLQLTVAGLDAIDGTPVLDVKPWMVEFAPRGDTHQPTWSHELMAGYWTTNL